MEYSKLFRNYYKKALKQSGLTESDMASGEYGIYCVCNDKVTQLLNDYCSDLNISYNTDDEREEFYREMVYIEVGSVTIVLYKTSN